MKTSEKKTQGSMVEKRKSTAQNGRTTPSFGRSSSQNSGSYSARTPRSQQETISPVSNMLMENIDGNEVNTKKCTDGKESNNIVEKYNTIPLLRFERLELMAKIEHIDRQVERMLRMKCTFQKFCVVMEDFSTAIFKLDRNNQGVPYVANVKTLIEKIYSDFNAASLQADISRMQEENIPYVKELNTQFQNIHRLCDTIIVTHIHYHVSFLEDFHMVAGKIRGMMKTIVTMFYDDDKVSYLREDSNNNYILQIEDQESTGDEENTKCDEKSTKEENKNESNEGECETAEVPKIPTILLEDFDEKMSGSSPTPSPPSPSPSTPRVNSQIVKELIKLRVLFHNINNRLGEIQRLSLGNPRKKSLQEIFATVNEALKGAYNLFPYYEQNNVPCIDNIKSLIVRMRKLASLKRPLEKHVEQLKMLLGDCDGRVLIISKCLSAQTEQY